MELTTSETLNRAADLIEERGWAYGKGWGEGDAGPLCLEGGIAAALGLGGLWSLMYSCPAYRAVRTYLNEECVWLWNDSLPFGHKQSPPILGWVGGSEEAANAHGQARVIEVLRATALIEAAREEQDAAWETYAEAVSA